MNTPINRIQYNTRQERFWRNLFLATVFISALLISYLIVKINQDPLVVVADGDAYTTRKAQDFSSTESLHTAQAELAVQSIFNRRPGGLDSPKRAQKLFMPKAHEKLLQLLDEEVPEFQRKAIHQKVGISNIELLRMKNDSVTAVVEGQLIRAGDFADEPIIEVLDVKVTMQFVTNPNLFGNRGFPTLVKSFSVKTTPVVAR